MNEPTVPSTPKPDPLPAFRAAELDYWDRQVNAAFIDDYFARHPALAEKVAHA